MTIKAPATASKVHEILVAATIKPYAIEILHATPHCEHGDYVDTTEVITPLVDCAGAREVPHAEKSRSKLPGNPAAELKPCNLLDALIKIFGLKNDSALAGKLEISSSIISKIRHKKIAISGMVLLRMHEVSDLSLSDLRFLMNDFSPHFGPNRPNSRQKKI